jgi:hypothetical protein
MQKSDGSRLNRSGIAAKDGNFDPCRHVQDTDKPNGGTDTINFGFAARGC